MADKCRCGNVAYDDCAKCGEPTCREHGKKMGDVFVCKRCIDKYGRE